MFGTASAAHVKPSSAVKTLKMGFIIVGIALGLTACGSKKEAPVAPGTPDGSPTSSAAAGSPTPSSPSNNGPSQAPGGG